MNRNDVIIVVACMGIFFGFLSIGLIADGYFKTRRMETCIEAAKMKLHMKECEYVNVTRPE